MRFEGVLSSWDPAAGRGTILPKGGGQEVMVRLTAFPMDGDEPHIDERLSFEIVSGRDGRKQAAHVKRITQTARETMAGALRDTPPVVRHSRILQRKRRMQWMAGAGVVAVTLAIVYVLAVPKSTQVASDVPATTRR